MNLTKIYTRLGFPKWLANNVIDILRQVASEPNKYGVSKTLYNTQFGADDVRLKFDTKSPITKYQILRLDTAPDDYMDFQTAKIIDLNKAVNVGFEDTIEPNRDYYYCFRAINAHGYASNPSPIMHVNVFDNGNIHVGDVKPYIFPTEAEAMPEIEPLLSDGIVSVMLSEHQSLAGGVDPTKTDPTELLNTLPLMAEDENRPQALDTSGKSYFKLRVRSRSTGREMDLNFFPKVVTINNISDAGESALGQINAAGLSGGDMVALSNYFDLSTKSLKALFTTAQEEFGVDPQLIQAIVDKLQKNKLDQQALQSLLVNYKKLKST